MKIILIALVVLLISCQQDCPPEKLCKSEHDMWMKYGLMAHELFQNAFGESVKQCLAGRIDSCYYYKGYMRAMMDIRNDSIKYSDPEYIKRFNK